ncbi:MAG: hypothetical protein ISR52_06545 [Rhodospirillales bacterium]|nr:hypothetical protein [Rhodospirillales bacterium]
MSDTQNQTPEHKEDPFGYRDFVRRWQMMPFRRHLLFGCYLVIFGLFCFILWMVSRPQVVLP